MYKFFLAHSSKDKKSYVDKVAHLLDQRIGRANFIYDTFSFDKDKNIKQQIISALGESGIFILFLSTNSIESPWVKFELLEALKLYKRNKLDIFIVNIDNQDLSKDLEILAKKQIKLDIIEGITEDEAVDIIERYYKQAFKIDNPKGIYRKV